MAIAITTAGIKVMFGFESSKGVRPSSSSDYTLIPQVKEIPEMNPAPDTLETTSFDNLEYKTYTNGLKDLGGTLGFTANYTQELVTMWQDSSTGVMKKWEDAKNEGKAMYLCIVIPGIAEACYLSVEPAKLGLPSAAVNEVMEVTLNFTPVGEPTWTTKPAD